VKGAGSGGDREVLRGQMEDLVNIVWDERDELVEH
jgi:hypothetical protein